MMEPELREGQTSSPPTRSASAIPIRQGRTICGDPPARFAFIALALLAMTALLSGFAAHRGTQISPFDEATHADYAWQIAHGHIPAKGDVIAPEILHEWRCRGAVPPTTVPACADNSAPLSAYPAGAENYNFNHPPLYYAITGLIARGLNVIYPGHHFIALGRLLGIGWLYAAMLVLYSAVRRLGANSKFAACAAALLPLCPVILHASSAMTNDAAAALCGALAVWLLARVFVDHNLGWVAPTVIMFFCVATKVLNALPILVVGAVFAVAALAAWRAGRRADARALAVIVLGICAAFLLVYLGWSAFQHGRGLPHWVNPIKGVSGIEPTNVVNDLFSTSLTGFSSLVSDYYLPKQIDIEAITIWARGLSALVCAVPFVLLLGNRAGSAVWILGVALLGGLAIYPIAVELQVYISSGDYFPNVVVRYGMSFIPLATAGLALAAWRRGLPRTLVTFTAIGTLAVSLGVFGLT